MGPLWEQVLGEQRGSSIAVSAPGGLRLVKVWQDVGGLEEPNKR